MPDISALRSSCANSGICSFNIYTSALFLASSTYISPYPSYCLSPMNLWWENFPVSIPFSECTRITLPFPIALNTGFLLFHVTLKPPIVRNDDFIVKSLFPISSSMYFFNTVKSVVGTPLSLYKITSDSKVISISLYILFLSSIQCSTLSNLKSTAPNSLFLPYPIRTSPRLFNASIIFSAVFLSAYIYPPNVWPAHILDNW